MPSNTSSMKPLRIGLFTDTYMPTMNGISVVVSSLKDQLELLGHEVFVVCPATPGVRSELEKDKYIITVPSIKGWPYKEYDMSFFVPFLLRRRLQAYNFDAIMFFTPGQLGLMATSLATITGTPLVAQHSTDIPEYVLRYPLGSPAGLGILAALPFFIHRRRLSWPAWRQAWRLLPSFVPWVSRATARGLAVWYAASDVTVALSRKSQRQIMDMAQGVVVKPVVIPSGIDALPLVVPEDAAVFRNTWGIAKDERVLLYVGRIASEKNLAVLIPALERLKAHDVTPRLVFVGDFDYRATLEAIAAKSTVASQVIFTGKIERAKLGAVYASADIFMFPSLTDTQGLVLHEAAQAGLPIILCDPEVTEVARHDRNAQVVPSDSEQIAHAVRMILDDDNLRRRYGVASKKLARQYSERIQAQKINDLLLRLCNRF